MLETHGYFNESTEASIGARGLVESVVVIGHNEIGTVICIETTNGNSYHYGISNQAENVQQTQHKVELEGKTYTWTGSLAQL